jgi:glycosyltransferase involved in cell wall biosynthesis
VAAGAGPLRRILTVGRLVERKGVQDVIAALADVPETELVVVGGPSRDGLSADPDVRRLAALAEQLGVLDRVDFRGRVGRAELPALLRSADAVVCAPWYEPFGIVPLEAMACGVPVVATAVGGMLDSVADGVTGLLVAPRRPDQVAAAVREILDDPALARRLGHQGVRRAQTRYGWDHVAALTRDVYAPLVRTRAAHRHGSGARA